MDDLYNSPPLLIETPTSQSGTGSQISMSNSNPGFFPSAAPSDPGVENRILHLLQGISVTQDQQTTILTDHGNDITSIGQIVQNLTALVHHNVAVPPAPPYPAPPGSSVTAALQAPINPDAGNVKIHPPRIFDGRSSEVEGFLNEMDDCVYLQRKNLKVERDKCYYFGRYLKDGSLVDWFLNLKQTRSPLLDNFMAFQMQFKAHFGTSDETGLFLRKLHDHTQTGAVHSYISKFHNIILHLELSKQTKILEFHRGLKDELKKSLIGVAVPATLEQFKPKDIQINNDLHEYNLEKKNPKSKTSSINLVPSNYHSTMSTSSTSITPRPIIPGTEVIPMEVDATFQNRIKLTADERKRWIDGNKSNIL